MATVTGVTLTLTGCAYRLYAPFPPSLHTLTIVAKSPEQYWMQVQSKDYPVAADGKVTFDYPSARQGCGVYLFGLGPINQRRDPLKEKTISVTNGVKVLNSFSLDDISNLPRDSSGYHILNLKSSR